MKLLFHSEQHPIDSKIRKSDQLYLNPNKVHTDDNWLFVNYKLQEGYKHNYKESDFTLRITFGEPILEFNLFSSPIVDINTRTYEKLPTALASLTVMCNMIMILCFFITNLSNNLHSIKLVLNELYTFPSVKKKDDGIYNEKNCDMNQIKRTSIFEKFKAKTCEVIIDENNKPEGNFSSNLNMEDS